MIPGETITKKGDILMNDKRRTLVLNVSNTGDRAVQVGSHFHFFEVNRLLKFDRKKAYGMRLDIPSGTSVRFEPGEDKQVDLVEIGGNKRVVGLNNLTNGQVNQNSLTNSMNNARIKKF